MTKPIIRELANVQRVMVRHGELPNTVAGVSGDPVAIDALASSTPTQLEVDLIESAIIDNDEREARLARVNSSMKRGLLRGLADDISEGETRHQDGTPMTVDEFDSYRRMDERFADLLRARADDEAIYEEANSLFAANDSRAFETPTYNPNESVRIMNARKILGRSAARATVLLSAVAGSGLGTVAQETALASQGNGVTASGAIVGTAVGVALKDKIGKRIAHRRAGRIQKRN